MKQREYEVICKKLAKVCELISEDEENTKKQKESLLKRAKEFKGLSQLKLRPKRIKKIK